VGRYANGNHVLILLIAALLGWLVPGGGHFLLKEKKRSIIIFTAVVLTFAKTTNEFASQTPRIDLIHLLDKPCPALP